MKKGGKEPWRLKIRLRVRRPPPSQASNDLEITPPSLKYPADTKTAGGSCCVAICLRSFAVDALGRC